MGANQQTDVSSVPSLQFSALIYGRVAVILHCTLQTKEPLIYWSFRQRLESMWLILLDTCIRRDDEKKVNQNLLIGSPPKPLPDCNFPRIKYARNST